MQRQTKHTMSLLAQSIQQQILDHECLLALAESNSRALQNFKILAEGIVQRIHRVRIGRALNDHIPRFTKRSANVLTHSVTPRQMNAFIQKLFTLIGANRILHKTISLTLFGTEKNFNTISQNFTNMFQTFKYATFVITYTQ